MTDATTKSCGSCGRTITWRRKWASCWQQVRYCSQRCRNHKVGAADLSLERAITAMLARRRSGATICPSEVARTERPQDWRAWMERVRAAARRMAARGELEVLQGGRVVDPATARGPIRLRR